MKMGIEKLEYSKGLGNFVHFSYDEINKFMKKDEITISNLKIEKEINFKENVKFDNLSDLSSLLSKMDNEDVYKSEEKEFITTFPSNQIFFLADRTLVIAAANFTKTVFAYNGTYSRSCQFLSINRFNIPSNYIFPFDKFYINLEGKLDVEKFRHHLNGRKINAINRKQHEKDKSQVKVIKTKKMLQKEQKKKLNAKREKERNHFKQKSLLRNNVCRDEKYEEMQRDYLRVLDMNEKLLNDKEEITQKSNTKARIIHRDYANIFSLQNDDIKFELQIILGNNNHVSKRHVIHDKVIRLAYLKPNKRFNIVEVAIHYCQNCQKYFDFYESFKRQLEPLGIKIDAIVAQYYDEYGRSMRKGRFELQDYSRLTLLGYSVGTHGKKNSVRQDILRFIIDNKMMSVSEIKKHLQFLIHYNGSRSNMENAIHDWQEDIVYLNKYIIKRY